MPAWGIEGGGPKNDQAISDLVAYLKSIQLSPAKAKAQVLAQVAALKAQAKSAVSDAKDNLATAQDALSKAETPKGREAAQITIVAAQQAIVNSQAFATQIANASQGELLFDVNCARCHTKGWSYNDPAKPTIPPPAPAGSGAFGPSLRNGAVLEQFPGLPGGRHQDARLPEPVRLGRERRPRVQGLRRARHLVGQHGALRRHPEQGTDRRHHQVRAEPLMGGHGLRLFVLAAETGIKNRDLWYPTILGVLVVVAAVSLFCGSVYLLLATNLGARLGFLVAAAGLSGFMVLLSCLWLTTASPLNTLKGRVPTWKAVESIKGGDLSKSKIPAVRAINKTDEVKDPTEQSNVKAAVDQVVVTPEGTPSSNAVAATSKFAIYTNSTDYLVPTYYETGGGNIFSQTEVDVSGQFPLLHVSLHKPHVRGRRHLPGRHGSADRPVRRGPADPEVRRDQADHEPRVRTGPRLGAGPPVRRPRRVLDPVRPDPAEPPLAGAGPAGARRRGPGRGGRARHRRRTHP